MNVSRDGASTTSQGNLFQCLTILIVKNFLISNLNLPSFSLKPLPFILSLHALVKKFLSSFLVGLLPVLEGCCKVSLKPSLLQAEQPQLSQPFFTGEVFHPTDHFVALLWATPTGPCLSCAEGSRAGCRTPGGVSPRQSRGAESPPSPCWPCWGICICQF